MLAAEECVPMEAWVAAEVAAAILDKAIARNRARAHQVRLQFKYLRRRVRTADYRWTQADWIESPYWGSQCDYWRNQKEIYYTLYRLTICIMYYLR